MADLWRDKYEKLRHERMHDTTSRIASLEDDFTNLQVAIGHLQDKVAALEGALNDIDPHLIDVRLTAVEGSVYGKGR